MEFLVPSLQKPRWLHVGRILAVLAISCLAANARAQYDPPGCVTTEESRLAEIINDYRQGNGLPAVPLSETLSLVAQWHVQDSRYAIEVSGEYGSDATCNLHSWYGMPGAPYTTCCYTADHAQAQCMWDKPGEITASFVGFGFEIAAAGLATVDAALAAWQNSPGHNDVILNLGSWSGSAWTGMGVGVDLTHKLYYVWFSNGLDPAGTAEDCAVTAAAATPNRLLRDVLLFPNPANPRSSVEFELANDADVTIEIFDATGRRVRSLFDGLRAAGAQSLVWPGTDDAGRIVASGIYFVRVRAGDEIWRGKLALAR